MTRKGVASLNRKQRRFVEEFLVDCNGAAAARRAGYSHKNADNIASWLRAKPQVAQAIAEGQDAQFKRLQMSADETLALCAAIARAELHQAFNVDGTVKPLKDWPVEMKIACASAEWVEGERVQVGESGLPLLGPDNKPLTERVGLLSKFKLHDKVAALSLLLRKHGLLKDKVEHSATESFAAMVVASFKPEGAK